MTMTIMISERLITNGQTIEFWGEDENVPKYYVTFTAQAIPAPWVNIFQYSVNNWYIY